MKTKEGKILTKFDNYNQTPTNSHVERNIKQLLDY